MDKDYHKLLVENDREWRTYIIKKLEKMDSRVGKLEVKAFGFLTVLFAVGEFVRYILNK